MAETMYLNCDYTGASSRIEYGKKGDQVTLIKIEDDMALVQKGTVLFHVKKNKLSVEPVQVEEIEESVIENHIPVRTPVKKKVTATKQNTLF